MKEISNSTENLILKMARKTGVVRAREIREAGLHPEYLRKLCKSGQLIRTGRGLYSLADGDFTEHHSLAEACKRVPHGIICLLSALSYHEIGTQNPHQIWMAIDRGMRKPKVDYPPIRIFRFSGLSLEEGIEEKKIEGVSVRLYNPAKTVADCFKYRNKVGIDVAIEALKECWRSRRCEIDELVHYSKICRVSNIMQPYMEAIVS
jgi:predicted transcriptional regulator of viral defense system